MYSGYLLTLSSGHRSAALAKPCGCYKILFLCGPSTALLHLRLLLAQERAGMHCFASTATNRLSLAEASASLASLAQS